MSTNPVVFPNSQELTSTALTDAALFAILQSLVCGMLGITGDATNTAVRQEWNTDGAPAWTIGEDVTFIEVLEAENSYEDLRDIFYNPQDDDNVTQVINYTRVWRITFIQRGPNGFDRTRTLKTALLLDWTHDSLATSNLYMVPKIRPAIKVPEEFQKQWWQRNDLTIYIYEQINDSLSNVGIIKSVELKVYNDNGQLLDETINSPD